MKPNLPNSIPLAERMRPQTLDDYIGQQHLIGKGGALRAALDSGFLPGIILWGPPGVGKTTLAGILARATGRPFHVLSAINAGVKDIREIIDQAQTKDMFSGRSPVLFIDEIHRFSKSQQDSLLGAVERGTVTLIGATTENPSFEVIPALLSRCQVHVLKPLGAPELLSIARHAIERDSVLSAKTIELAEADSLIRLSGGDARRLLNVLEMVVYFGEKDGRVRIDNESVDAWVKQNPMMYDKAGEMHYDIASAFIKSMRGSDPNAAVYYLARMIEGGEKPEFIARRMLILSSEDIGLANPNALLLANAAYEAVERIGWPESRIILSECAIYLACSAKSNSAYAAINLAQEHVRKTGNLSVPLHLRNAPTKLMKDLGYGSQYEYSHNQPDRFSAQEYLPTEASGTAFYTPAENPAEQSFLDRLKRLWKGKYGY
jgi:putative ATPase